VVRKRLPTVGIIDVHAEHSRDYIITMNKTWHIHYIIDVVNCTIVRFFLKCKDLLTAEDAKLECLKFTFYS